MYDLKALQAKEVEILKAVHDVCEKLQIEYTIGYGTLIGAVRHKGFIPWDDDIDICMTRDCYDIFIREGQKYLPDNLKIQHALHEKKCPNIFAKVRDCNTTFLSTEHVDLDINQGIFIDIFPVDRIKSGRITVGIELVRRQLWEYINECFDLAYVKTIKRPVSKCIGLFLHYVVVRRVMRRCSRAEFILKEEDRRRKLHKRGGDCTIISTQKRVIGEYSLYIDRTLYEFNGYNFYGPVKADRILTLMYGDYMTIPPKEEQITHKPIFVSLSKGYSKKEIDKMLADGRI